MWNATIRLPKVLYIAIKNMMRQKHFLTNEIAPLVAPFSKTNDGTISSTEIKKIYSYYGLGVPAVLGEGFALLHNRSLNHSERFCTTALGALTGLFDDYLDKKQGNTAELLLLIFKPEMAKVESDFERLFQTFAVKALENIPDKKRFENSISQIIDMQLESANQHILNDDKLLQLTLEKGGKSLLFYRMALPEEISAQEQEILFHLGGLMQMGNDIFDVFEDTIQGTETIFTRMTTVANGRSLFIKQWQHTFDLISDSDLQNTQLFADIMAFGLARCFVCLNQFEKLEHFSGSFQPKSYEREQLICDMEKPKNLLSAINHFIQHKKQG